MDIEGLELVRIRDYLAMVAKLLKFLSVAASAIELFALIGLIVITNDKPTPFVFDNLLLFVKL